MTSPMRGHAAHDTFTLLDGSKEWKLPGTARVTASLSANTDEASVPGGTDEVSQLQEASGTVRVTLTMTTHEEWTQYRHVLGRLRRGTGDGPAVFTCAHPEVRTRGIKRLYFQEEQADPYSARAGYTVTLTFKEKIKKPQAVANTDDGTAYDYLVPPPAGDAPATTKEGAAMASAAATALVSTPKSAGNGKTTADAGYCSAWTRAVWQDTHGGDRTLFGGSAVETEGRFRKAGQYIPWTLQAQKNLQAGDLVFYGNDPSGFGHVGVYDGKGGVMGNNLVSYKDRGGLFDGAGRPTGYDAQGRKVDARGTVPIGSLGTPTGIGKPTKVSAATPVVQGPAAPLPPGRPSATVPGPR